MYVQPKEETAGMIRGPLDPVQQGGLRPRGVADNITFVLLLFLLIILILNITILLLPPPHLQESATIASVGHGSIEQM